MKNSIDELTKLRAEGYSLIMANAELTAQYQAELNELNARYKPLFDANQKRLNEIQSIESQSALTE